MPPHATPRPSSSASFHQVNISAVHLEVDPSHAAAHSCSDPLCAECSPGGAPAEGSPPLPEVCHRCLLDYTPAKESGACVPPSEADVFGSGGGGAGLEDAAAAAKQPGGGGAAPEYSPPDFSVADCCSSGSQECCFGGGSGIGGPVRPAWWWQHCYQGPSDCRQIDPATAANPAKPCGVGWFLINQASRVAMQCCWAWCHSALCGAASLSMHLTAGACTARQPAGAAQHVVCPLLPARLPGLRGLLLGRGLPGRPVLHRAVRSWAHLSRRSLPRLLRHPARLRRLPALRAHRRRGV